MYVSFCIYFWTWRLSFGAFSFVVVIVISTAVVSFQFIILFYFVLALFVHFQIEISNNANRLLPSSFWAATNIGEDFLNGRTPINKKKYMYITLTTAEITEEKLRQIWSERLVTSFIALITCLRSLDLLKRINKGKGHNE